MVESQFRSSFVLQYGLRSALDYHLIVVALFCALDKNGINKTLNTLKKNVFGIRTNTCMVMYKLLINFKVRNYML